MIKEDSFQLKNQLRYEFKIKREKYDKKILANYNKKIFIKVLKFVKEKNCQNIFIYVSKDNEVDTKNIIEFLLKNNYNVIVPKTDFSNSNIMPVRLDNLNNLKLKKFGLLEPDDSCKIFDYNMLDVIFVPGIVFDKNFHRIGYGRGFFDKFLYNVQNLKTGAVQKRIGLAYSFQIVDEIPVQKFDICLDGIITEQDVFGIK